MVLRLNLLDPKRQGSLVKSFLITSFNLHDSIRALPSFSSRISLKLHRRLNPEVISVVQFFNVSNFLSLLIRQHFFGGKSFLVLDNLEPWVKTLIYEFILPQLFIRNNFSTNREIQEPRTFSVGNQFVISSGFSPGITSL